MNRIIRGDLVWIPDGTTTYMPLSIPIKGPDCGLVMEVLENDSLTNWLQVRVGAALYTVDSKDVRRINREEITND